MSRKPKYPGYHADRLPSGNTRHRVRVEGEPSRWVRIFAGPGERGFRDQYHDARAGVAPRKPDADGASRHSLAWLIQLYTAHLEAEHLHGRMTATTIKKARLYLGRLSKSIGHRPALLKRANVVQIRDSLGDRPAAADDTVTRLRQMYDWAIETGTMPEATINPAKAVRKIDRGKGGAIPWTTAEARQYLDHHAAGTTAHALVLLLVATGCRIGDAFWLGADQELQAEIPEPCWRIDWRTGKTGMRCSIPLSDATFAALRPFAVPGRPYIAKADGAPYASAESLGQMFARWVKAAGLKKRSAHGLRKMVAGLAAEGGADSYAIAAMLGHSSTVTSEVYTKHFRRHIAAASAVAKIDLSS